MEQKKYDIFICYSSKDLYIIEKIVNALTTDKVNVFIDRVNLSAGNSYADLIMQAIQESSLFVYFLSENSSRSNWCQQTLSYAQRNYCKILPICIGNIKQELRNLHQLSGLDNYNWLVYDASALDYREIADDIKQHLYTIYKNKKNVSDHNIPIHRDITREESNIESLPETDKYENPKISFTKRLIYQVQRFYNNVCNKLNKQYTIKFRNSDRNHTVKLLIDGCFIASISPCGVHTESRSKGNYAISFDAANDKKTYTDITQTFNNSTNGTIVDIKLPDIQEQPICGKSSTAVYRCFIGGSTTIANERNAVRAVLSMLYNRYDKYNFFITAHTFEDFDKKHVSEGQQHLYDEFIRYKADCTIFIICNHVGEKTIHEYNTALETYNSTKYPNKRPSIFVYNKITNEQDDSIKDFQKQVKANHAYWSNYKDIESLMSQVKEDINGELFTVLDMSPKILH